MSLAWSDPESRQKSKPQGAQIPLSRGMFAVVDVESYPILSQHKWYASRCDGRFYAARVHHVNGRRGPKSMIYMHRFLARADSGQYVDHINGDSLDNRSSNLRLATNQQNCANSRKSISNTSGFKGVTYSRAAKKWVAQIVVRGRHLYLGLFLKPEDAHVCGSRQRTFWRVCEIFMSTGKTASGRDCQIWRAK